MGDAVLAQRTVDPQALARIQIPAEFISRVNSILEPGATVLVTDEPLSSQTNGAIVQIADADPPNSRHRSQSGLGGHRRCRRAVALREQCK
jgi:hypothetical protein